VLQALPDYSIAHFACHGLSSTNPANSHLLLRKGCISADCTAAVDELRVKDIAALKLPAARLAYLSACSTAESASSALVDEVTHIVSSFHIAGFIHVIGALWPSQDQACQKMAIDFYSELSKTDNVAVSYRTAIMGLMRQKPLQPLLGTIHTLWRVAGQGTQPYPSFTFQCPKLRMLTLILDIGPKYPRGVLLGGGVYVGSGCLPKRALVAGMEENVSVTLCIVPIFCPTSRSREFQRIYFIHLICPLLCASPCTYRSTL